MGSAGQGPLVLDLAFRGSVTTGSRVPVPLCQRRGYESARNSLATGRGIWDNTSVAATPAPGRKEIQLSSKLYRVEVRNRWWWPVLTTADRRKAIRHLHYMLMFGKRARMR